MSLRLNPGMEPSMPRFIVTMTGGVPAVAKLKANLPRPWKLVFGKKNESGELIAICEAPGAEDARSEELGRILSSALGHTEFEWWEEKEYTAGNATEHAALELLKLALAAGRDNLPRTRGS